MIFNVRRASNFPLVLEAEEEHALTTLEDQGRWLELEELERSLRQSDSLKEVKVECERLDEILIFLNSLNTVYTVTINFQKRYMIIQDNGEEVN